MAGENYKKRLAEVEALQAELEELRKSDLAQVIAEMNDNIKIFRIKPSDLIFGTESTAPTAKSATEAKKPKKAPAEKLNLPKGKYKNPDDAKVWSGKGRPPDWLKDAIAAGAKAEDMLIPE